TRFFGPSLREAAAEARAILIEMAAEHLTVDKSRLVIREGVVAEKDNPQKRVSYAGLTQGKTITRRLSGKPSVKKFPDFKKIGKGVLRKDAFAKVTGKAQYAGDIRLPGMLYARILRPPVHGATLKTVDVSGGKNIKNAVVVQDRDLIAALHPYPDEAEKAFSKIKAEFQRPQGKVDPQTIFQHLLKVAPDGSVLDQHGEVREGEKAARQSFEATYFNQYVAHAPMETHTATAKVEKDRVTVWASTQTPFPAKDQVAQALGMPSSKVRIIAPFVGGGFGGKSQNSQIIEAVRLARLTGKPVQVAWTRQEEFFYDTFRPAAVVKIRSGVNDKQELVLWHYENYFGGSRGGEQFYDIPHHREIFHGQPFGSSGAHPFGTGPWRAPGNNTNTFARESHIDGTAAQIGMDPLEFRLRNLKDTRMIGVLKAAAQRFGWTPAPAPSGRGFGVACGKDSDAYVAAMAQVEVERESGQIRVKRIVCAQDMGLVINPEGARMQMEGCATMGLGYALTEEIRFRGGEILNRSFDTYEIPRFSWVPKIETVLVENPEIPPAGG
ncbi:MAG TPA: molybdopterin cofactor-binding domain-containing protein, partial [Candidatus Acidoferrum sp.]|nr:molybdopterin cofactor-binding domain-containing protein [Candidatus Acidoferrum sp.]